MTGSDPEIQSVPSGFICIMHTQSSAIDIYQLVPFMMNGAISQMCYGGMFSCLSNTKHSYLGLVFYYQKHTPPPWTLWSLMPCPLSWCFLSGSRCPIRASFSRKLKIITHVRKPWGIFCGDDFFLTHKCLNAGITGYPVPTPEVWDQQPESYFPFKSGQFSPSMGAFDESRQQWLIPLSASPFHHTGHIVCFALWGILGSCCYLLCPPLSPQH